MAARSTERRFTSKRRHFANDAVMQRSSGRRRSAGEQGRVERKLGALNTEQCCHPPHLLPAACSGHIVVILASECWPPVSN